MHIKYIYREREMSWKNNQATPRENKYFRNYVLLLHQRLCNYIFSCLPMLVQYSESLSLWSTHWHFFGRHTFGILNDRKKNLRFRYKWKNSLYLLSHVLHNVTSIKEIRSYNLVIMIWTKMSRKINFPQNFNELTE